MAPPILPAPRIESFIIDFVLENFHTNIFLGILLDGVDERVNVGERAIQMIVKIGCVEQFPDAVIIGLQSPNHLICLVERPVRVGKNLFDFGILELIGIVDMPLFQRNRVSNQKERTEMVMLAAQYLDDETVLNKLPFITVDEVERILMAKDAESHDRFEEPEEPKSLSEE